MRKGLLTILALLPLLAFSQVLNNMTNLTVTKSWSQEPNGYTYPVGVRVPMGAPPQGGFPVCILLHGNMGNGMAMIGQFAGLLECHVLVGPTGYQNSWNICSENSDAPDVEMVEDLVNMVQGYSNIDPNRIRIVGFSNGAGLANRVYIENNNQGIDAICAVVSHLNVPQYHSGDFYMPTGTTDPLSAFCGYDGLATPLTSRRYLSISNANDSLIPYVGGTSPVGVDFLPAEEAAYIIAQHQGFTGSQLTTGTSFGNPMVTEFSYLSDSVVLLEGDAAHGVNSTQLDYIKGFLADCALPVGLPVPQADAIKVFPNPAQDVLIVERSSVAAAPFRLMDPCGKVVFEGNSTSKTMELDLSELAVGLYHLQLDGHSMRVLKCN